MKSARVLVPILVSQLPKKVSAIGPLVLPARPGGERCIQFWGGRKIGYRFGGPFLEPVWILIGMVGSFVFVAWLVDWFEFTAWCLLAGW